MDDMIRKQNGRLWNTQNRFFVEEHMTEGLKWRIIDEKGKYKMSHLRISRVSYLASCSLLKSLRILVYMEVGLTYE